MGFPQISLPFLSERLPADIASRLTNEPPELVEGTFIDSKMQRTQSDVLLRVNLTNGQPMLIYLLIEHKSYRDWFASVQLLRYQTRIITRLSRKLKQFEKLPPIYSLLVYHGEKSWETPLDFQGIVCADDNIKPLLLNFVYGLVDLSTITDDQLSRERQVRAALLAMKLAQRAKNLQQQHDGLVKLMTILKDYPQDELAELIWEYIFRLWTALDELAVRKAARQAMPEEEESMVSAAVQRWMDLGRIEGRDEGRTLGKAEILFDQLTMKFESGAPYYKKKVFSAPISDIERWCFRILTARTIDEIFHD